VRVSPIGFNACCLIQAKTDIQSFRFNFSLGERRLVKVYFIRAEHSRPSGFAPEGVPLCSMQGAHAGRLIIYWIENADFESLWQVNPLSISR
jgi:hypothetical protein